MYTIRKIKPEDDQALAALIRLNLKNHHLGIPGTAYFDSNLDHLSTYYIGRERAAYFVLDHDGRPVGCGGYSAFPFMENCAELQKLYIHPDHQGKGLSRELVKKIEEGAKADGYADLYLETHTNLYAAMMLYEKTGFLQMQKPEAVGHSTMNRFYIKRLI